MDYDLMKNNKVFISGEIVSEPKFTHEVFNEGFYEFDLKVSRLSDIYDIIPVTVSTLSPVVNISTSAMSTSNNTIMQVMALSLSPPALKLEKKPGPTCKPIE